MPSESYVKFSPHINNRVYTPTREGTEMSRIRDPKNMSLTLNVSEVAQLLSVSKRTIYRLLDSGLVPKPIKLGNATRWRRRDIELFVEAGSIAAFRRAKRAEG